MSKTKPVTEDKEQKDKEQKDKYNFVLYVPEITHHNWKLKDEKVLLEFEVKHFLTRFLSFMTKKKPKKDMLFDDMCSSAWLLIDGERSIFEIARIQSEKTEDAFQEDLRRVVEFVKFISKKGWVRYKKVKNKEDVEMTEA